jgi:hypothetical protein
LISPDRIMVSVDRLRIHQLLTAFGGFQFHGSRSSSRLTGYQHALEQIAQVAVAAGSELGGNDLERRQLRNTKELG